MDRVEGYWADTPFHQPAEFLFCYLPCFIGISRPFVLSIFKSFVQQYAYLIKQRLIAPEVITHFAKKKLLYEDKKHHNAVFVGMDSSGTPRQAHKRSTTTFGNSFRQTIEGSDTKYSFAHFGKSNMLFVFEAPIDMMSFLTLYPKDWEQHSYTITIKNQSFIWDFEIN